MKSLLVSLAQALTKIEGNHLTIEDREYDEYFCTECKKRVHEEVYNEKQRCCYKCWYRKE